MYQLDVDSLSVDYKYDSGDGVMCLCEFHEDTHPSMFVNLVDGFYYCFACGAKGDIDSLIKQTGGIKKYVPYEKKQSSNNGEWKNLLTYPIAKDDKYLLSRGFTNESIEYWELRSNEEMVVIPVTNDCIKVRLKNAKGKIKYLTFGNQPRYVSSYSFGVEDAEKTVFVTEGMFGLIRYHQLGYNAITPLSVGRFENLIPFFNIFKANYLINFDPDIMGYLNGAKLLFKTFHLDYVRGVLRPYDIDKTSKVDIMVDTTKSPELYLGHINQFGQDKMIDSIQKYKKYIKV